MSQRASDMSLPRGKRGCTSAHWTRMATTLALEAGVDPVKVMAGDKRAPFLAVRWGAWRKLAGAGFSYFSIGQASGFDHTTVIHACDAEVRAKSYARHAAREARVGS